MKIMETGSNRGLQQGPRRSAAANKIASLLNRAVAGLCYIGADLNTVRLAAGNCWIRE
jgi:hypothetical protein